jgi:hypothetical protein
LHHPTFGGLVVNQSTRSLFFKLIFRPKSLIR